VLLNRVTDGVNLLPTYRKPFDLTFRRTKNEEWSALADDFGTFFLTAGLPDGAFPPKRSRLKWFNSDLSHSVTSWGRDAYE